MPECSPSTPDNLFAVTDNGTTSDIVLVVASVVATGILAASATVLVRRWRAATKPARRALGPVLFTGLALLAALTALFAIQAVDNSGPVVDAAGIPAMLAFAALPFAFLAGLLRNRWSRAGAVGELVERLGVAQRASLPETLADAMGDPTLAPRVLAAGAERYVDARRPRGRGAGDADPARAATMVERDGGASARSSTTAACSRSPSSSRRAAAAALALENERLEAELRARLEDLQRVARRGSSRPAWPSAGGSSATCTTAPSSASSRCRCTLRLAAPSCASDPTRRATLLDRRARRAATAPSRSCASSPAASTRPCSPTAGSAPRSRRSPRAPDAGRGRRAARRRLPAAVEAAAYFVVAEALANMAKHAARVARDRRVARAERPRRRRGPRRRRRRRRSGGAAAGCAGSPTASRPSTAASRSISPPGAGTTVRARIPCESS